MKKQEQIDILSECVLIEATIACESCRKIEGAHFIDEDDLAKDAYKKGWRFKNEMCLCPQCIKKIRHD